MQRTIFTWLKSLLPDSCALGLLVILGLVPFAMLFTSQPFIYGDNSFHYAEFYYALTQPILANGQLIHWNPDWFAGIPEFQFYPVGFVIFGILLYSLSFHLLSIGFLYNLLLLIALIFPAIAGYLLIRKLGFHYIAAFFSGLFLLILPNFGIAGGFYYGVFIGLFSSRIAFGLGLISLWFGINLFAHPERYRYAVGIAISLALTILFHPDLLAIPIAFLAALLIGLYTRNKQAVKPFLKSITIPIIIGVGLTGFWLIPMLANHGYTASMQIWSNKIRFTPDLTGLGNLIQSLWHRNTDKFIIGFFCCSILYALNPKNSRNNEGFLAALMITPGIILIGIIIIKYLVMGLFQITAIDPARLIDGITVYLILGAGIGFYQLIELTYRYLVQWKQNLKSKLIGSITLFLLFIMFYYASFRIIYVYFDFPKMFYRNPFLPYILKNYQLDELWKKLAEDKIPINPSEQSRKFIPSNSESKVGNRNNFESLIRNHQLAIEEGRILITAIGLSVKGMPIYFKSQALCLTPIYTGLSRAKSRGRQIIGGTNAPFYPIASYLYFGKKPPLVIQTEADKFDNRSLLGIPWEQMEESRLLDFCRRLNITDIVVNQNEDKVLEFFSRSTSFRLAQEIDEFKIYSIPNYTPSWIEYDSTKADISVTSFTADSISLSVTSVVTATPILVKVAYYPCWKAVLVNSASRFRGNDVIPAKAGIQSAIAVSSDEIGLMHLVLPPGENYQVQLQYQRTGAETIGYLISIFSFLVLLSYSLVSHRKKSLPK
ncbi:MAG: hypothetical protein ACE14V_02060 [bacterium]